MFIYIRCIAFYTPLTSSSFFSMLFFVVSYKNHDSILVVYWKTNIQTVPELLEHLGFAFCYFWFFFLSRFVFFDSVILAFSMECYEFFCLIDCFRFFSFFVSFLKTFSEPFKILWLMKWWLHYGTQRTLTSIIWYCDNMWHFQNNSWYLPVMLFDTVITVTICDILKIHFGTYLVFDTVLVLLVSETRITGRTLFPSVCYPWIFH